MPIISTPEDFNVDDLFVDLREILHQPLYLKCEAFNFAGSIKIKPAKEMVDVAEREGRIGPDTILVESSSGNLGVALSLIAASRGYRFRCVTDTRCNPATRRLMEALGSEVHVIGEPHPVTGYLGARLDFVRELCSSDPRCLWLDQYANPGNWRAHYATTAPAISRRFPDLDVLFVGAGTTGTLMGCARFFAEQPGSVRVVAVDTVGSVTFGGAPSRRLIPGLGTSVRPPLLDQSYVHDVVHVPETATVTMCRQLAAHGFVVGGSSGTVLSGAAAWLSRADDSVDVAVAIAPDMGERYLDTLYSHDWVRAAYGTDVTAEHELEHV